MRKPTSVRIGVALLLGAACMSAFAVQRTFIASYGLDDNPCNPSSPCRSFATALDLTDPRDELIVLDSAGYGTVTITKPVSVVAPEGIYGGISVFAAQDGITVDTALTTDKVVLRGLTINGQGGSRGIVVQQGRVHIERCVVSNMAQEGIRVEGSAVTAVYISHSVVRDNTVGILLALGNSARVFVDDTQVAQNASTGILMQGGIMALPRVQVEGNSGNSLRLEAPAGATLIAVARDSTIMRHPGRGLKSELGGVANSCGGNMVVENAIANLDGVTAKGCIQ
jgi:hypothetical protein